jgi:glycosyltransferase involved in cell wall biosynthesis
MKAKGKILVLTRSFDQQIGGMETHTASLVEHLAALGFDIDVLTPPLEAGTEPRFTIGTIRIRRTTSRTNRWLKYSVSFWREVRSFVRRRGPSYDVILNISMAAAFIPTRVIGAKRRPKMVSILHGCYSEARHAMMRRGQDNLFNLIAWAAIPYCYLMEKLVERRVIKTSDVVIAVSDTVQNCLKAKYPNETDKMRLMQNFVDRRLFTYVKRDFTGALTFLYIGRLHPEKGVLLLLEAFARLKDLNIQLLIVGDGPERETIRSVIRERTLSNITMVDAVEHSDVGAYMHQSHVLVFPSLTTSEGLPLTVLEGMATGLPVIASDIPALEGVIQDGENGFRIRRGSVEALAAQMRYCVAHPEVLVRVSVQGVKTVQKEFDRVRNLSVLTHEMV